MTDESRIPLHQSFESERISLPFPVVGIGASAGGLEALEEFFRSMPPTSGMAFVVISHQTPGQFSRLPGLLAKVTAMPSLLVGDRTQIMPNCIYTNPPGQDVDLMHGEFRLSEVGPRDADDLPIDHFLNSLANERRQSGICVILSGTGTDGTIGMKAIKAQGGLAFVQSPESARYSGMPISGIATQLVDAILAPGLLPAAIASSLEHHPREPLNQVDDPEQITPEAVQEILGLLHQKSGHDFSLYRRHMIQRRIARRIFLNRLRNPHDYLRLLETHPEESHLLLKELLISVTNFFRDPEAFEVLAKSALTPLLEKKENGSSLRAWVPGCATGEEVFSLAIVLSEIEKSQSKRFKQQIFGTDLDAEAIDAARRGHYSFDIRDDVTDKRVQEFFLPNDNGLQIRKDIRERTIFAVQDLIRDPPFTRLDIICCRNVLIYLDNTLQSKVLSMFHHALTPGGILFLGSSEAIRGFDEQFQAIDKQWKIFARKGGPSRYTFQAPPYLSPTVGLNNHNPRSSESSRKPEIAVLAESLLASRFAPHSMIVNAEGELFYVHGEAGVYLEAVTGRQPNNSILDMAREGLRLPLASVMRRMKLGEDEVQIEHISVTANGRSVLVDLSAIRLNSPDTFRGLILITISECKAEPLLPGSSPAAETSKDNSRQTQQSNDNLDIERELSYARESLHGAIDQLQTSNQDLQSANEELQSSNEELETSREELQSLNEELQTVNVELESKVDQLSRAKDDMQNLLNSIDIATIFLDRDLKIRRFTQPACALVRMIETDIGRSLGDLALNLKYDQLLKDCTEVLHTLIPYELEVESIEGKWSLLRIRPYRTVENEIDGLVVSFVDISKLKKAEQDLREKPSAGEAQEHHGS